jgi:hypothetical protein
MKWANRCETSLNSKQAAAGGEPMRRGLFLMLGMLALATAGCRTFNYTDEDLARERQRLAESSANGSWGGWGWGGSFNPGIGKIKLGGFGGANIGDAAGHGK